MKTGLLDAPSQLLDAPSQKAIGKQTVLILICLVLFPGNLFGQSNNTGLIRGNVKDPKQDPLVSAKVQLVNIKTNIPVSGETSPDGSFELRLLRPGNYRIVVTHERYFKYEDERPKFHVGLGDPSYVLPPPIFTLGHTALTGRVTGLPSGEDFNITVVDAAGGVQKTITDIDPDGSFILRYIPLGKFTITISKDGYADFIRTFVNSPRPDNGLPPKIVDLTGNGFFGPIQLLPAPPTPGGPKPQNQPTRNSPASKPGRNDLTKDFHFLNSHASSTEVNDNPTIGQTAFNLTKFALPVQEGKKALTGSVTDSRSKELADVTVAALHIDQKTVYATLTDASGRFRIPDPLLGNYFIVASKEGYVQKDVGKVEVRENPIETTADTIKLEDAKAVPLVKPTINNELELVTEQFVVVKSLTSGRGGNFSNVQIEALPIGGISSMRSFDEMAFLIAGVAPPPFTPGLRGPGVGFGVGTAGSFSVNGMRARSNNFSVDGSDNNDPDVGVRRQGFVALVPQPIETINEFQMLTLLWDAEGGRNFGSQVNVVTKYGGNDFHGETYVFFTDSTLNARNFFDYTGGASRDENPFTRTQSGFVISGPVVRDRTHFFSGFEYLAVNTALEQHFSSPLSDERGFKGRSKIGILDPLLENNSNIFFQSRKTAPLGNNFLSLYPEPNNAGGPYGENTYTEVLPASGSGGIFSSKVTHELRENNNLDARYNFTDDERTLPSVNRAIRSTISAKTRTQNLSLIFNTLLASHYSNQVRFSYGRTRLNFLPYPGNPFTFSSNSMPTLRDQESGARFQVSSETGPIGEVVIEPFNPVGVDVAIFPQQWVDNTFQYADTLGLTQNKHSSKIGFDIRRVQLNTRQERNYRPRVVFGNSQLIIGNIDLSINNDPDDPTPFDSPPGSERQFVSGIALAAIGLPSSIFQTITLGPPDSTIGLRFTEASFFINDNWRIRPDLTLDYGLRYEYNTVPHEINDRIENALSLKSLPIAGASRFDSEDRSRAFNASVNAYSRVLDGRTRIYEPDRNNFGPHIGFAWTPARNMPLLNLSTVIRGGYGIYYDTILGAVVTQSRNVFPNEIPLNVDPTFGGFDVLNLRNPSIMMVSGRGSTIPLIAAGTLNQLGGATQDAAALIGDLFLRNRLGGGLAFTLPSKDLRTPYAQHWHLTFERQLFNDFLFSLAYVGTRGTKLTRLSTPNLGPNVTVLIPVATTFTARNANDPDPDPLKDVLLPAFLILPKKAASVRRERPEPDLGAYQLLENSASSNYHAFQFEARKRYSKGYTFTVAYTWSHVIDDVSDIFPISGAPILAQDSFNHRLERASANFDIRHRFATSFIWDLPFYKDTKSNKGLWLGNWQIAAILQANTGQPFTLNVPVDANLDGNLTDRPSTTAGLIFLGGHNAHRVTVATGRNVTDFFEFGQNGLVGRNTLRGDSFVNLDVALNKGFILSANKKLQFRTEIFNAFNRANFGLPIRTIGAPGFGNSVETINPARIIQFAVKLSF